MGNIGEPRDELLTLEQAGKLYGKNYKQMLYAVEQGRIKAQKVGWVWIIKREDLPPEWPKRVSKKRAVGGE